MRNGHRNVRPDQFPDFIPNYELELHPRARATNFIHRAGAGFGFVMDALPKDILEKFKLPRHHFYPMKVYHNGKTLPYFWFHYIVDDFWDWVDRDQSIAVIQDIRKNYEVVDTFDLDLSVDEIKKLKKTFPYYLKTKWQKLVFKSGFPYDFYKSRNIMVFEFIGEDVAEAFEKAGVTGLEINYTKNIVVL